jgi:predicted metal-binding membrane protein
MESILRRDRLIVGFSLVLVSGMCWVYILFGAGMDMNAFEMTRLSSMSMDMVKPPVWTPGYLVLMYFMWWIMMIAMMLPSATPVILLAAALNRRSDSSTPPFGSTSLFVAGYLLAWGGFSIAAVIAQWWLQQFGWLNGMLVSQNQVVNGFLLLAAGLWQFSPWKYSCLAHCRSPVEFLTKQRPGSRSGALRMGLMHGGYCLGCCWFLMALLFAGGVMNLYWIVGLALYVWVEKMLPGDKYISRSTGGILTVWGLWFLVTAASGTFAQ